MSDNKNNPRMEENLNSSFEDNPFASNPFADNNSSFESDSTDANSEEYADFGSDSSFSEDSSFGSDSSFAEGSGFSSDSIFGEDSTFGNESSFGNESGFGDETSFGSESSFGESESPFANVSTDHSTSSPFGSDSASLFGSSDNQFAFGGDGFTTSDSSNFGISNSAQTENKDFNKEPEQKGYKKDKKKSRDVTTELSISEYKRRIKELNNNAENKHYVLFFGRPGSGKSYIIGSIINYLRSYSPGHLIYHDEFTTVSEDKLYYSMLDFYQSGKAQEVEIASSDKRQYYEFPFTYKTNNNQTVDFVFVDCSGEHTQRSMYNENDSKSGALPNYLTAILESDVNVKICFVYDYCNDLNNKGVGFYSQTNNLISAYNEILHYQNPNREFSKLLIMSKADRFKEVMNKYDGSASKFAKHEIPAFANSFANESFNTDNSNSFTFYSVGEFLSDGQTLKEEKLDIKAPEKIIKWLYENATGVPLFPVQESLFTKVLKKLGIRKG